MIPPSIHDWQLLKTRLSLLSRLSSRFLLNRVWIICEVFIVIISLNRCTFIVAESIQSLLINENATTKLRPKVDSIVTNELNLSDVDRLVKFALNEVL